MTERLLVVHAHPDDETIATGGVMSLGLDQGHSVTLVTCTAGEAGEILVPELAHHAQDRDDTLAEVRKVEYENAMAALRVADYRWLGGFGTYRDSGMEWAEDETGRRHAVPGSNIRENAFWFADLTEASNHLVPIIRETKPTMLITYDQFGNYGHPDHIQAHRVAMYATQLAGVASYLPELGEAWQIPNIYWIAPPPPFGIVDPDFQIDVTGVVDRKIAALKAYPTQVDMDGDRWRLPHMESIDVPRFESFRLVQGVPMPGAEPWQLPAS